MASLFVKDLHPNVTESVLLAKFSSIGPLQSLRVCREAQTNRSLGYAYVNFVEQIHANRAIETMNYDLLEGKSIRLVRSERNPFLRKIGEPNVFVKNLHKTITTRELFLAFSQFGNVLTCKVTQDRNGLSKGYGLVQLEDEESVLRSIVALNGLVANEKLLVVKRYNKEKIKKSVSSNGVQLDHFTNVYIKNIVRNIDEESLKKFFEKCGQIISSKIMIDSHGISRGFGFISFENAEAALKATVELNGTVLSNGKTLYVCRAQTRQERDLSIRTQEDYKRFPNGNLYVSNLDGAIDDNRLWNEFQCYGTVISAKVITDKGQSIGLGYVCFSRYSDAMKAVSAMNGRIIGEKPILVSAIDHNDKCTRRLSFGEKRLLNVREVVSSPFNVLGVATSTLQESFELLVTEKRKPNLEIIQQLLTANKM